MKKIISVLLVLTMGFSMLTGCSTGKNIGDNKDDENTLTITVTVDRVDELLAGMQEQFPDINFEIKYYVGDNGSVYLSEEIRQGNAGDIIFYSTKTGLEPEISQMMDLSGYSFTGQINDSILNMLDMNGHIYQIPGPLDVRCIVYNKTMFEEKGWEVPTNFDEQIALVKQIREEAPEVVPVAMAFLPAYSFVLPMTLGQAGYLSTSQGYEWEQKYFKGEASFGEGVAEGLDLVERLVEANAFDAEKYVNVSDCNEDMINGKIAMYYVFQGLRPFLVAEESADNEYEFGLLPFYGKEEGDAVVGFNGSSMWSLNKRLEEKGNEKKLENALSVMEWLVTPEAQSLCSKSRGQVPVVKGITDYDSRIDNLMQLAENGYMAYGAYAGYEHMLVETGQVIQDMIVAGDTTDMLKKVTEVADPLNKTYIETGIVGAYYSVLKEDINEAETVQLMANMLQDYGAGDFTLITHTGYKNGVVNKAGTGGDLYAGPINDARILVINAKRNYHISTIDLSGAEVKELLETGKEMYSADTTNTTPEYFDYYWAGIDVTMADGKVKSAKFNGEELDDAKTYKVVFAETDYATEYGDRAVISETLISDVMIAYMDKNPELYAPEVLRK